MRKCISLVLLTLVVAFGAGFLLAATGVAAAPLLGHGGYVQIVAEVFLDTAGYSYQQSCPGCDGFWDNSDWCGELYTPLLPVTLILKDAETGEEIKRLTTRKNEGNGRSWAYFSVQRRDSFVLEVESVPEGFETCPTSLLNRHITHHQLQHGRRLERFYFWWGCPPQPPIDDSPPGTPPPPPPPPGTNSLDDYYGCGIIPIYH
jgi:hypothetical protein